MKCENCELEMEENQEACPNCGWVQGSSNATPSHGASVQGNSFVKACLKRLVPQLTGLTITGGVVDDTGEYWGFCVEGKQGGKAVKKVVFVNCDPEGNGPGFLEIEDE